MAPFEFPGGRDSCIGCADIIRPGDTVVPLSDDRPDRLLCVACWWSQECDMPLPRWARRQSTRTNLAGAFVPAPRADLSLRRT